MPFRSPAKPNREINYDTPVQCPHCNAVNWVTKGFHTCWACGWSL